MPEKSEHNHLCNFLAFLFISASFAFQTYVALAVFDSIPFSSDEYSYMYQAKIFVSGKTFLEVPPYFSQLVEMYLIIRDGRLFTMYPPGFPLVLAVGEVFGLAALVNPLICSLVLFFLYRLVKLFSSAGMALTALALLASNPYFFGYGASFFSQPLTMLVSVLIFYNLKLYEISSARKHLLFVGILLGAFTWIRPFDALFVLIIVSSFLVFSLGLMQFIRKSYLIILPCLYFISALLIYNYHLGHELTLNFYNISGREFRFATSDQNSLWVNALIVLKTFYVRLVTDTKLLLMRFFLPYTAWVTPALAVIGLFSSFLSLRWRVAFILYFLLAVFFYTFHSTNPSVPGWPQYGSRYWYPAFWTITLLAAFGLSSLVKIISAALGRYIKSGLLMEKVFASLFMAVMFFNTLKASELLDIYSERFRVVRKVNLDIREKCAKKSIVVLDPRDILGQAQPAFVTLRDFKRNQFLNSKPDYFFVYHRVPPVVRNNLPEYSICNYRSDGWDN